MNSPPQNITSKCCITSNSFVSYRILHRWSLIVSHKTYMLPTGYFPHIIEHCYGHDKHEEVILDFYVTPHLTVDPQFLDICISYYLSLPLSFSICFDIL
jgi:hypothetical protein